MRYEILNTKGEVTGTIISDESFVRDKFTAYRAVAETPSAPVIRKIRQDAFMDRFTFDEQLRMQISDDPVIKVFKENAVLVKRPYIDLDHPMVQQALPYLVGAGMLDGEKESDRQKRMGEILSDGIERET